MILALTASVVEHRLVFLRILEYYEGILFLTTNRVQVFDAAFHSRIHVSINYPELSAASRRHIWSNFLTISGQNHDLAETDFDTLAEIFINGRQIKNVIKTARLIAMRKNAPLSMEHIQTVMSVMENIQK
jgi:SpoVK/Ycf46/Vps4 family AAA+-type ATPase